MGAEARRTAPRRQRRKEARPQELTAAALALFVEKGFAATRLDEIAAHAGVSKGTLYLYFDSKEALFEAVIREGIVPALVEGEALLQRYGDDPVQLLRCILSGWWARIGATELGGIPKLMVSEAGNFPAVARYYDQAVIQRGLALLRTALERGIAREVFRPVDVDTTARLLIAPLVHLALWQHSFGACCGASIDAGRYLDTHFDLILRGLSCGRAEGGAS